MQLWALQNITGSASLATTVTGTLLSQRRYLPYGETRWSSGPFPTDRRYTGQREEVTLGVYDYGARFYSPGLGRFLSADTLVPEAGRPQAFNRYSYALNNPVRYTDPSGHWYYDPGLDAVVHQHGVNYNERPQYLHPIQTPQTSVYAKPQPQNLPSPVPVPAAAGPLLPYAATPGHGLGWPLGPYNSQPQSFPPQLKGHETVIEPSNGPSRPLGWQPQIARWPHLYLDLRKVNYTVN